MKDYSTHYFHFSGQKHYDTTHTLEDEIDSGLAIDHQLDCLLGKAEQTRVPDHVLKRLISRIRLISQTNRN